MHRLHRTLAPQGSSGVSSEGDKSLPKCCLSHSGSHAVTDHSAALLWALTSECCWSAPGVRAGVFLLRSVWLSAPLWAVACQAPLLCPWEFSGKSTRVGCHLLLQGIFPTQGLNPCLLCLLHWQAGSLPPVLPGKPRCTLGNSLQLLEIGPKNETYLPSHYSDENIKSPKSDVIASESHSWLVTVEIWIACAPHCLLSRKDWASSANILSSYER